MYRLGSASVVCFQSVTAFSNRLVYRLEMTFRWAGGTTPLTLNRLLSPDSVDSSEARLLWVRRRRCRTLHRNFIVILYRVKKNRLGSRDGAWVYGSCFGEPALKCGVVCEACSRSASRHKTSGRERRGSAPSPVRNISGGRGLPPAPRLRRAMASKCGGVGLSR